MVQSDDDDDDDDPHLTQPDNHHATMQLTAFTGSIPSNWKDCLKILILASKTFACLFYMWLGLA